MSFFDLMLGLRPGMSEENKLDEGTPTPPLAPVKKHKAGPGRPKKHKTGEAPSFTSNYEFSISERIRQRVNPDIIIDFYLMILQGQNAHLVPGKKGTRDPEGWTVQHDPNPNATSPTLAQKMEALRSLENRGWGLPVQSINIDAEIKARLEGAGSGISNRQLMGMNPQALEMIAKALALPDPNVIDAEFVDVPANSDDTNANSAPQDSNKSE